MYLQFVRTTIEIDAAHRARLLALAARRGEKGFSKIVAEALDAYLASIDKPDERKRRARSVQGALSKREAEALRAAARDVRTSWR